MAQYNGTIDLISGIRPKNGGSFPLVDAKDVQVKADGTRLDQELENLHQAVDNAGTVKSVAKKTPDANGAVTLTPDDLGAASAQDVSQLKDDFVNIENVLEVGWQDESVTLYAVNGFYTGNVGSVATLAGTDTNWHSAIANLNDYQYVKITVKTFNSATFGAIFVDDDMRIISKELQGQSSAIEYDDELLIVPTGATKVIICSFYISAQKIGLKLSAKNYEHNVISVLKSKTNNNIAMNYIYVSTSGNDLTGDGTITKPFATIYHANEIITDNSKDNRYTIVVKNGTYTDLQAKYAGTFSGRYEGVTCKDYVYYESENILRPDLCVISWDGATGYTTPVTEQQIVNKCPFHITKDGLHTHIKGFTITCKNTRYAMHIEMAEANGESEWLIEHCIFNWGGRPDQSGYVTTSAIGCGTAYMEKGVIRNCEINLTETGDTAYKNWMIFQTHDNNINPNTTMHIGENVLFENVKITKVNGVQNCVQVNLRCNKNTYDVPPFAKFVNVVGFPLYLNLEGNAEGQTYNVVLEATNKVDVVGNL